MKWKRRRQIHETLHKEQLYSIDFFNIMENQSENLWSKKCEKLYKIDDFSQLISLKNYGIN